MKQDQRHVNHVQQDMEVIMTEVDVRSVLQDIIPQKEVDVNHV